MNREEFTNKNIRDGDLVVIVIDSKKDNHPTGLRVGLFSHNKDSTDWDPHFSISSGINTRGHLFTPRPGAGGIRYSRVLYIEKITSFENLREIYENYVVGRYSQSSPKFTQSPIQD